MCGGNQANETVRYFTQVLVYRTEQTVSSQVRRQKPWCCVSVPLSASRIALQPVYHVIATPAPSYKPGKGSIHWEISPGTPYTMLLNKVLTERRERLEKEWVCLRSSVWAPPLSPAYTNVGSPQGLGGNNDEGESRTARPARVGSARHGAAAGAHRWCREPIIPTNAASCYCLRCSAEAQRRRAAPPLGLAALSSTTLFCLFVCYAFFRAVRFNSLSRTAASLELVLIYEKIMNEGYSRTHLTQLFKPFHSSGWQKVLFTSLKNIPFIFIV